jgi:hypothetical protein
VLAGDGDGCFEVIGIVVFVDGMFSVEGGLGNWLGLQETLASKIKVSRLQCKNLDKEFLITCLLKTDILVSK